MRVLTRMGYPSRLRWLPIAAVLLVFAHSASAANGKPIAIYDAMSHHGKPDLSAYGLRPIRIIYDAELFRPGAPSTAQIWDEALQRQAQESATSATPIVLDVEQWEDLPDGPRRYEHLVMQFKTINPNAKLGFYALLPRNDYWRANSNPASPDHRAWVTLNDSRQGVADRVDALYPSLYTFYDDSSGWVRYATENIKEARRLAKGKPVIAFLWPKFHESNSELRGKDLSAPFWRTELETARALADGIVIWGGGNWNESAAWWVETKEFIAANEH